MRIWQNFNTQTGYHRQFKTKRKEKGIQLRYSAAEMQSNRYYLQSKLLRTDVGKYLITINCKSSFLLPPWGWSFFSVVYLYANYIKNSSVSHSIFLLIVKVSTQFAFFTWNLNYENQWQNLNLSQWRASVIFFPYLIFFATRISQMIGQHP